MKKGLIFWIRSHYLDFILDWRLYFFLIDEMLFIFLFPFIFLFLLIKTFIWEADSPPSRTMSNLNMIKMLTNLLGCHPYQNVLWNFFAGLCHFCSGTFSWCCSNSNCNSERFWLWKWTCRWNFQMFMGKCSASGWDQEERSTFCEVSAQFLSYTAGGVKKKLSPFNWWWKRVSRYQHQYLRVVTYLSCMINFIS